MQRPLIARLVLPALTLTCAVAAPGSAAGVQPEGVRPHFDAPLVVLGEDRRLEWVVDLNGDAFPDAVGMYPRTTSANENLAVHGWINDGHGGLQEVWDVLLPQIDNGAVKHMSVGDLNGDGREDMVICAEYELHVLLSQGASPPTMHFVSEIDGQRSSAIGDFDGNGVNDIAVSIAFGSTRRVILYRNHGNGTQFSQSSSRTFEATFAPNLLVCDIDGDSTDDLAISHNGDHRFFPVAGGVLQPQAFGHVHSQGRLTFGDIDGDGDGDFVSFAPLEVQVLRRIGPTSFLPESPYLGGPATHLADIDRDGDLDGVCCGGSGGPSQPGPNNIDSRFEVAIQRDGRFERSFEIRGLGAQHIGGVADMDQDGDLDLVAGRVIYYAQGALTKDPRRSHLPQPLLPELLYDLDNDGDPDAALALGTGQRNFGDGTLRGDGASHEAAPDGTWFEGPGFHGDFDGDGDEDLIVSHFADDGTFLSMRLLRNSGGGHLMDAGPAGAPGVDFNTVVAGGFRNQPRQALVADADGDGDLDLFVRSQLYYVDETFLWRNQGSGFLTAGEFFTDKRIVGVGSFNADGYPDLVANQSGLEVLFGTASGDYVQGLQLHNTGSLDFERLAVGDADGDGNDDIVDFAYHGLQSWGVHAYLGDGLGNFTPMLVAPTDGEFPHDMQLVDVNGDGHLDVAAWPGVASDSSVLVALFDSTARTWNVRPEQILGGGAFADVDGDGDVDHVGLSVVDGLRFHGASAGSRLQRGLGTPGTGGIVPMLGGTGPFRAGETGVTTVRGARGGAEGLVLLAISATPTPLAALPGATLIQDFGTLRRTMPIQCDGAPGAPGEGSFAREYLIPPSTAGTTWRHRCVIFDRDAPDGRAWTNEMLLRYE